MFLRVTLVASSLLVSGCAEMAMPPERGVRETPFDARRPASVPGDFIVTPEGYFHPSCVHEIGKGEVLESAVSVAREDGSRRQLEQCAYVSFNRAGKMRKAEGHDSFQAKLQDGWQVFASLMMPGNGSMGYQTVQWTVPNNPTVDQGQTLYYFSGAEQNVTVMKSVLGWNQLGVQGWSLASWNCCEQGSIFYSTPMKTVAGTPLQGKIYFDAQLNRYHVQMFSNPFSPMQQVTELTTRNYSEPLNYVLGAVVEHYGVASCQALPPDGSLAFWYIDIRDANDGQVVTPLAATYQSSPCGYALATGFNGPNVQTATLTWDPRM